MEDEKDKDINDLLINFMICLMIFYDFSIT